MDTVFRLCISLPTETLKWLSSLPILMQKSFWWWQCRDRYIISLSPHLHTPFPPFSPSLIRRTVTVDIKHHVYDAGLLSRQNISFRGFLFGGGCGGGGGRMQWGNALYLALLCSSFLEFGRAPSPSEGFLHPPLPLPLSLSICQSLSNFPVEQSSLIKKCPMIYFSRDVSVLVLSLSLALFVFVL